ncbi:unnamed protein product [Candidula unifasciata]|uniref:CUB domain-containing protein n=1 Tax=Candidula unifasciata TaxID=100452 RepID=A0A8S3ZW24_9EUPU|nr:unnamed protein product [Candidula unifasciata]
MYLKSNKVVITFRNIADECTVSDMPTVEVRDGPVMLALPLAYNSRQVHFNDPSRDTPCPVRLWNPDTTMHLRLDVMGTDKQEADCDTDVIQVSEMSSGYYLERSCNRGKNPVYRQSASDSLIVTSTTDVYMRAATVDSDCDGNIVRITADNSQIKEQMIPRAGKYSNLDTCKYLISGENREDTVHLTLTWETTAHRNQSSHDTVCQGDYINIYDGDRETSAVLFSSCWSRDETDGAISTTVVSSQRHLLVVLDADAKIEGKSANMEFHSIPGGHHCTNITEVHVDVNGTSLTAPNYPGLFPMNQVCVYRIIAENREDSLVIDVQAANLDKHCNSYLAVFHGRYEIMSTGFPAGRICEEDKQTFRIHGSVATMVAVSGNVARPYAWRVSIYVEKSGHSTGNTVTFSLTVLILIHATQLFVCNA